MIAGEGVQQMSGRETRLEAGVYVVVPRGTAFKSAFMSEFFEGQHGATQGAQQSS